MEAAVFPLSGLERRGALRPVLVPIAFVDPPIDQLRASLDPEKLQELACSIRDNGLLQPPGLRVQGDRYVVVYGHRRTEACRLLGWREMPALIVEGSADSLLVMAAAENLERSDLSPAEEMAAVCELYARLGEDVDAVARRVNRSRAWVESRLRMQGWPPDILSAVHQGLIGMGVGAELACVSDDVHREFLLGHAARGGCTARTAQAWRQAWELTGTVTDATVAQVAPGAVPLAPVEAELPCWFCGDREIYSKLTHVWLCAEGLRMLEAARSAFHAAPADTPVRPA